MRIVQTFWSAGRNPLEYSFGWLRPEYNLMSWTLSCLCLRKYYDEVALYTDEQGKHVLIDLLHLPYTEVHVVYDEKLCLPQHWAYPKIKTYSLQTTPFLHVDGDVFLPAPIPENIINAPVVVQNREIGTAYYQRMMQRVFQNPSVFLPVFIRKGIDDGSLASYNMGIFGGSDIDFIHKYCHEVFRFINQNHINDVQHCNSGIECNVFFEQILLAAMADKEQKEVESVVSHPMYDQGYSIQEFCNLRAFDERPIHHLLGGHKQNTRVLRMLVQAIIRLYPGMFRCIIDICPNFISDVFTTRQLDRCQISDFRPYADFVETKRKEWSKLDKRLLIELEHMAPTNKLIQSVVTGDNSQVKLSLSPFRSTFILKKERDEAVDVYLRARLHCGNHFPLLQIVLVPTLSGFGYVECPLLPIDMTILKIMFDAEFSYAELANRVLCLYFDGTKNYFRQNYIRYVIKRLIVNGIINLK